MTPRFRVELFESHDRTQFTCGVVALDRYLREQATQDMRRRATACYVAVDTTTSRVVGFYTLAAGGIPLGEIGADVARKLPRYPSVPVARLGRLAVDEICRGGGLGALLLWDAASRAARSELMAFALVVDAKDDAAAAFYRHHGFMELASSPRQLFLPLAKVR